MKKRYLLTLSLVLLLSACSSNNSNQEKILQLQKETAALGQVLFFDKNLSFNKTQSCATCHNPEAGFVDNRDNGIFKQASLGANGHSIGDRQAPTASYAMFSPKFHYDKKKKEYIGGQFWDGRAATLAVQAGGPPTNPGEMAMKSEETTSKRLQENPYYVETFKKLYGKNIFIDSKKAYLFMTKAIEAFEQTKEFAPFDSKYDRYLQGTYDLTATEDLGMSIFFSNNNNSCASCHLLKKEGAKGETFTNYEFHNIGVPVNTYLRAKNGVKNIDKGLLNNPAVTDKKHLAKYKVPTLRNVAVTSPYMHNGVFKDLRTVVEFYDKYNNKTRTSNPETNKPWAQPEVKDTINLEVLKAKKQSDRKIEAIVAFLEMLTDKRYEHLIKKD